MRYGLVAMATLLGVAGCADDGSVTDQSTVTSAPDPVTSVVASSDAAGTDMSSSTTAEAASVPAVSEVRVVHSDGASFILAEAWETTGPTVATEFSSDAECVSAQIIDQELVEGGPGPSVYRAAVQICSQPAGSIDAFMEGAYGEGRGGFEQSELAGRVAYRLDDGTQTMFVVAGDGVVFQVVAIVETDPELKEVRSEQISEMLASLTVE